MGGMRTAFQCAVGRDAALPKWRAMEIDETCCKVYSALFGSGYANGIKETRRWEYAPGQDEVWRVSIDKLPVEAFEGADLWLMSPPCQPFTKTGNHLDIEDNRCLALVRVLEALPRLKQPPQAILLENVPLFRGSKAHKLLLSSLKRCAEGGTRYEIEEHVLDPVDFGFPNTRKRYYLSAAMAPGVPEGTSSSAAAVPLPGIDGPAQPTRPVRDFCGPGVLEAAAELKVPEQLLKKAKRQMWTLDLATGVSLETKTFTASYGKPRYGTEGLSKAGPLLFTEEGGMAPSEGSLKRFPQARQLNENDWRRMRYFSPGEVMALQGYPEGWSLPSTLGIRDQWRLIGNSINVAVVQRLLERLLARV